MPPISSCCLSGYTSTGKPLGTLSTIGGVACYVATPPPPEGKEEEEAPVHAVLIATDIFGLNLDNTKCLADEFAHKGKYLVVIPNLFGATAVPASMMEIMMVLLGRTHRPGGFFAKIFWLCWSVMCVIPRLLLFIILHRKWQNKIPIFDSVIDALQKEKNIQSFAIIGYCYGVSVSLYYGKREDGPVKVFAAAHGKIAVPEDITPLKRPGLFICADKDWAFPDASRLQAEALLRAKSDVSRAKSGSDMRGKYDAENEKYLFKFYPGTFHGFAVRGDENDPVVAEAKKDATNQALEFFAKHL
eukprot:gb/GEZN01010433.1/.p1 GENE.gb/GEZN01010433.1/~~gb/GEZN01010433.1/.p1  ORF type:complete len:301 (-),score=25.07 gb/GEZN01010433.1/:299-1201(-)